MPTILLDRKRINKALNKELSLEELEKLLEYIKCEIKEQNEDELLCEITTDRADCFSTEGIIRALKGVLGIEKGLVNLNFFEDDIELHVDESVKNIRPYVAMATVRGLKLDPRALESIIRFQEVLHETLGRNRRKASIGLYDLSKLDKKIFFKNMDLEKIKFIPLEKNEILDGYRILSETEKGKQYRHLVGQSSAPVLVDNNGTFLSMAPIINSQDAKVTTKTTDILIDSTGFDLNFITSIVGLMAYALSFYGGKVGLVKHFYPNSSFLLRFNNRTFELSKRYAEEILGFELLEDEFQDFLLRARYGFNVYGSKYEITVPFYRVDVLGPIDIVEDIAIIKGYENIEPRRPPLETKSRLSEKSLLGSIVREVFNGLGFQEIVNYMVTNSILQSERVGLDPKEIGLIYISNPISKEYDCMRANLFPGILEFLQYNRSNAYPQKIYELGDVLRFQGNRIITDFRLASAIIYNSASFEDMHSCIYAFFKAIGLDFNLKENELPFLLKGRRADILVKNEKIGWIGELNPNISEYFSLYQPIVAFELSLSEIIKFKFPSR